MKYLCLVYDERSASDETCEEQLHSDHVIAASPLQPASAALTVRVRNGALSIADGPFVAAPDQPGSFYLIEARDLNDAIRVASRIPAARIGCVEVRPIIEAPPCISTAR